MIIEKPTALVDKKSTLDKIERIKQQITNYRIQELLSLSYKSHDYLVNLKRLGINIDVENESFVEEDTEGIACPDLPARMNFKNAA
jgi:hypothetical protein